MKTAAILILVILASACVSQQLVKQGDTVEVHYTGQFVSGEVFDTSRDGSPLRFKVGSGQMISGFDAGVLGMRIGETKEVRILPEQAYGALDESKRVMVPVDAFEQNGVTPVVGETYQTALGSGRVVSIGPDGVLLDYNHPLAGETLIFEVTLVDIIS